MSLKQNTLKGLSLPELSSLFLEMGEPRYRARQVFNWMYNHRVTDFSEMQNTPKSFREKMKEQYGLLALSLDKKIESIDGATVKFLFRTNQDHVIESVIIPESDRVTLCVSTQVGCPLDCKFCATGLMGYKANLTAGEIFDQYLLGGREYPKPITNIVYMGMGEPLLNYEATVKSLSIFSEELTKEVSLRKITVSTSGIPAKIYELADTGLRVKLAFSLHSCYEEIRSRIMPINKKYPLAKNLEAVTYFLEQTGGRVTFEYVMLSGINDRREDEEALVALCRKIPAKINIIPFNSLAHINPTGIAAELKPSSPERIATFAGKLRKAGITVMVRNTKGQDIAAACGQLAVTQI